MYIDKLNICVNLNKLKKLKILRVNSVKLNNNLYFLQNL